jgi:hypothetical protein
MLDGSQNLRNRWRKVVAPGIKGEFRKSAKEIVRSLSSVLASFFFGVILFLLAIAPSGKLAIKSVAIFFQYLGHKGKKWYFPIGFSQNSLGKDSDWLGFGHVSHLVQSLWPTSCRIPPSTALLSL